MDMVNKAERKKLTSPEFENDFDLLGFLSTKNDREKSSLSIHFGKFRTMGG